MRNGFRARLVTGLKEKGHHGTCNMCTCSGNGTQERAVQDLLSLVDLYLVIGFDFSSATVSESDRLCYRIAMFSLLC